MVWIEWWWVYRDAKTKGVSAGNGNSMGFSTEAEARAEAARLVTCETPLIGLGGLELRYSVPVTEVKS